MRQIDIKQLNSLLAIAQKAIEVQAAKEAERKTHNARRRLETAIRNYRRGGVAE